MKQIKKILAVMLVIGMMMGLCACGSAKEVGKYQFVEMSSEGMTITAETLKGFDMDPSGIYIEFRKDGTGTLNMGAMGDGDDASTEFTWKDGKMTADGDTVAYTLDGKKITIDIDGSSMVFEK